MKNNLLMLFIMLSMSVTILCAQSDRVNRIIPNPVNITQGEGSFILNKKVKIYYESQTEVSAQLLAEILRASTGFKFEIVKLKSKDKLKSNSIVLMVNSSLESKLGTEGYLLKVTPKMVVIEGADAAGLFYGTQSLRQLLPAEIEATYKVQGQDWSIPSVTIEDKPRFTWRGYMKDVSRTFYSVEVIKKYLDAMSLYKLNTFHWHLTDDQGWRIEIKKYPKLTSEIATTFHESENQPAERSGFYTQEQIKEIVKYAADRHITIVPEIDVPGHSWATLLVYPELAVNNNFEPAHVFPFLASWGHWGIQFTQNTLDPTKEIVYEFLDGVFTEVAELFPGDFIHFGGDEVMHKLWENEPHVRAYMDNNGMKGFNDLQNYFVARVSNIIESKGKRPIGWNDILADPDNLTKKTAIMCWLGENAIKKAASNGYVSVATPTNPMYFDITQADRNDGTMTDLNYPNINTIEKVYMYDAEQGLSAEEKKFVLGVQANMWPAVPQEVKDINVQNFPRLLGVAEAAWVEQHSKDYGKFQERLEIAYPRLSLLKFDYYRRGGYITNVWNPDMINTHYANLEYDVTHKVYANGRINVGYYYTKGDNYLEIEGVELLENGKVISSDIHKGLADTHRGIAKVRTFLYNLKIDNYKEDATYTVRAKVRGKGGNDSYGNFTFNLSPYIPFSVVEPTNN